MRITTDLARIVADPWRYTQVSPTLKIAIVTAPNNMLLELVERGQR